MTINKMSLDEFRDLVREMGKQKDWPGIVDEVLSVRQDVTHCEERRERAIELLRCMDQRGISEETIISWVLVVYRELGELDVDSLVVVEELLSTDEEQSKIDVIYIIQFVTVFLNKIILNDVETIEQAEEIREALESEKKEVPSTHQKNEETGLFWNKVIDGTRKEEEEGKDEKNDNDHPSATISVLEPPKRSSSIHYHNIPREKKITDAEDLEKIKAAGEMVAENIFEFAKFVQSGVEKFIVPNIAAGIEVVGDIVIQNTEPCIIQKRNGGKKDQEIDDLVWFTDASVKRTDSIREAAKTTAFGIRDYSSRKIHEGTEVWKENGVGKKMIKDDFVREKVVATGRIGFATLGAVAILAETLLETTITVAKTSVKVASGVAHHTHGEEAGKLVNNTGVATGNILRTVTHVATLEASVLTKAVARNTAKVGMQGSGTKALAVEDGSIECMEDGSLTLAISSGPAVPVISTYEADLAASIEGILSKPAAIWNDGEILNDPSLAMAKANIEASIKDFLSKPEAILNNPSATKAGATNTTRSRRMKKS